MITDDRCIWAVACSRVLVDRASGNMSIIDAITQVGASALPAVHYGFGLGALLGTSGPPSEAIPLDVRLVRESDHEEPLITAQATAIWPADADHLQLVLNFFGLNLKREETLRFRIEWRRSGGEWRSSTVVPVRVFQLPTESLPG